VESAQRKWQFGRVYSPGCGDGIPPALFRSFAVLLLFALFPVPPQLPCLTASNTFWDVSPGLSTFFAVAQVPPSANITWYAVGPRSGQLGTQAIADDTIRAINLVFQATNQSPYRSGALLNNNVTIVWIDDQENFTLNAMEQAQYLFYPEAAVFGFLLSDGPPGAEINAQLQLEYGLNVPFVAPFSGAQPLIREPFFRPVINLRPSYRAEAYAMIQYLVRTRLYSRVSIFWSIELDEQVQGVAALTEALTAAGLRIASNASHSLNDNMTTTLPLVIEQVIPLT
jgi:ABC-type branched-subunit amino acid transport system substrate-binding protein